MMGMIQPSGGQCKIAGVDPTDYRKLAQVVGVTPQFDALWDDLSVKEHLLLFAGLKGIPKAARAAAVQQLAELVELDGDAFNRTAAMLSGGMKRRLSIAIAMIGKPAVLFLDEPTTGMSFYCIF